MAPANCTAHVAIISTPGPIVSPQDRSAVSLTLSPSDLAHIAAIFSPIDRSHARAPFALVNEPAKLHL
jgi:hypothetical protein